MEGNLAAEPAVAPARRRFPYSNWGPWTALAGLLTALGTGIVLSVPGVVLGHEPHGSHLTTFGNLWVQGATELGFLLVPMGLAYVQGAGSLREVLGRLGLRAFRPSAVKWMGAAIGLYLLFIAFYGTLIETHQEDIAEALGPLAAQVLLIAVAAPIAEETCFRGMLFGGLREKMPRVAAALLSGAVFGGLHALTGVTAVPPLIVFGFLLALLYEKTGSIVPGILLHMLNNSVALLGQ